MRAVIAGHAGGFLAAVLQRVKAERDEARGIVGTPDAEDPAFFVQRVPIKGFEWIGCEHRFPAKALLWSVI
jgi:hypothetical protein